jgi:hypothetical protein
MRERKLEDKQARSYETAMYHLWIYLQGLGKTMNQLSKIRIQGPTNTKLC